MLDTNLTFYDFKGMELKQKELYSWGPEQQVLEVSKDHNLEFFFFFGWGGGQVGVDRMVFKDPLNPEILCFYAESWSLLQCRLFSFLINLGTLGLEVLLQLEHRSNSIIKRKSLSQQMAEVLGSLGKPKPWCSSPPGR